MGICRPGNCLVKKNAARIAGKGTNHCDWRFNRGMISEYSETIEIVDPHLT
jgi:hypothetical protein